MTLDPAKAQLARTLADALAGVHDLGGIVGLLLTAARLRGVDPAIIDLALELAADRRATRSALGLTGES